jgi:hypothetical protein
MPEQEILDLVDELTQPSSVANWQHEHVHTLINVAPAGEDPEFVCEWETAHDKGLSDALVRRRDPSLLEQLRRAVTGDIGGGSGASKSARERTPMDVSAFGLLEEIDGRVRSWMQEAGEPYAGDLPTLLRAWYVSFTRYPKDEDTSRHHFGILASWRQRIIDIVDSPDPVEITSPCPNCGQLWVTRGHGHDVESVRALWAIWRTKPEDSEARCQGCGKVWRGVSQMRSLRIAIDEAEKVSDI